MLKLQKEVGNTTKILRIINAAIDLLPDPSIEKLENSLNNILLLDFDSMYSEILSFPEIKLGDPTVQGVSTLNEKLAAVQSCKSRILSMKMDCLLKHAEIESVYRAIERVHDDIVSELMLHDDVSKLKNVSQQKAAALLRIDPRLKLLMAKAKELLSWSETFLKMLEAKLVELQDINMNISRQVTICQIEANLLK